MSWLRSAVNRAVEASGKNNLTRTVKNYAGTVVQQAVAGGAKIIQDRIGARNYQSFNVTVKRLEEVAVSCRGVERIQLLRRWLVALKEADRVPGVLLDEKGLEQQKVSDESNTSSRNNSVVLYFDSDLGGEPMDFRDVFLRSQALEGITLSMILEPPDAEEVSLLLEVFGLCLTGGKEVHNAILSSIQDLGRSFSNYEDEVLARREELLQFAQGAITGLKLNADVARIDAEASSLREKVDGMFSLLLSSDEGYIRSEKATLANVEALKEALAEIRLCSKLKALLAEKRSINNGDSPSIHSQKVDKLKVLAESLASSSLKAEKRISDNRQQKEEAINYRVAKAKEIGETEKDISAEISGLEKQRNELEAQIRKVNTSLTASNARLKKTREERDQFDEASNQILMHLKSKEDDLLRSIASCKIEGDCVHTWITFLEDTWDLQSTFTEQKEKQTNDELEKYGKYLVKLIKHHITRCKEDLGPSVNRIRTFGYNLKNFRRSEDIPSAEGGSSMEPDPRKFLEEEYLEAEAKILTTFSVIDNMKELLYAEQENASREDCTEVDKLLDEVERMRREFKSLERPRLDVENPPEKNAPPAEKKLQKSSSQTSQKKNLFKTGNNRSTKKSPVVTMEPHVDPEVAFAKLESDYGSPNRDSTSEEIGGWEFDEF